MKLIEFSVHSSGGKGASNKRAFINPDNVVAIIENPHNTTIIHTIDGKELTINETLTNVQKKLAD